MDAAYFLGRSELLGWINTTLELKLAKIEETASGAVACQLMDALHSGVVPMKKVDFNAKTEYDYINNYKVLQEVFSKLNIDKHIEVQKLIKARPLDNMEFMQWFKSYFDNQTQGQGVPMYDGPGRRATCKTGDIKGGKSAGSSRAGGVPRAAPGQLQHQGSSAAAPLSKRPSAKALNIHPSNAAAEVDELAAQVNEWRVRAETYEKEKEFYYQKLRDIELLCQTPVIQDIEIMKRVEGILYAATQEEGHRLMQDAQQEFAGAVYDGEVDAQQGEPIAA